MKFTKNTAKRAAKTFFQAVIAYTFVSLKNGVDFSDAEVAKGFLLGVIAAGIAAVMNLEEGEQGGGTVSASDFIDFYLGKSVDYDGVYGVQCVDLAKLYIEKVIGSRPEAIGNAHAYYDDFENTYLKNYFKKIPFRNGVTAQKGDLVVWKKYYNGKSPYGHIAIASGEQTAATITTYDQNWNGASMKKVVHSVNGISGFLRPLALDKEKQKVYFKSCSSSHSSIVDALYSIGENYSYSYRKKIAEANGIKAYMGSSAQNIKMLSLLKKGKLIKP